MRRKLAIPFGVAGGAVFVWLLASDGSPWAITRELYAFLAAGLIESNERWPVLTKVWVLVILMIVGWVFKHLFLFGRGQDAGEPEATWLYSAARIGVLAAAGSAGVYFAFTLFPESSADPARMTIRYADNKVLAGEVQRFFALTPAGVRYSDRGGVEPEYGVRLEPVTPDVATNLNRPVEGRQPRRIPPSRLDRVVYFDPVSGQPRVWYAANPKDELEAFDGPGRHPAYGTPLSPVTPRIVDRLLAQTAAIRDLAPAHADDNGPTTGAPGSIWRTPAPAETPTRLVLACDQQGNIDPTITAALASALDADGLYLQRRLAPSAFGDAMSGNARVIERLGLNDETRVVVLARVTTVDAASDAGSTVTIALDARVFRPQAAFASGAATATSSRIAATRDAAASAAVQDVVATLLEQLRHLP